MAEARRSMTPFYAGLGAIAVVGAVLIGMRMRNTGAPLTLGPPVGPIAPGPRGVVYGSDSASVEITEFADFECGFCASFATVQMPDVKSRLIATGRVRWRFVHFPLPMHRNAPEAHLAAACAGRQNRFWEMHDVIYQNQDEWVRSRRPAAALEGYAQRLGLDGARYRQCVSQREAWPEVLADRALGDSLRVGGTPTFYINGREWETRDYSADRIRAVVDSIAPPAPARAGATPRR